MQERASTATKERLNRRSDARRRASSDLRQTRQKLAQGSSIQPEFEYEMLSMFVRNELSAAFTLAGLSAIFSLASMYWAPVPQAIMWLFMVIGSKVFSLSFAAASRIHRAMKLICGFGGGVYSPPN